MSSVGISMAADGKNRLPDDGSTGLNTPVEGALRMANTKLKLLSAITRHDINNQLTALTNYIDLMQARYPALSKDLKRVGAAAEQIGQMIRFSKEYEDIGAGAPVWKNCRSLVSSTACQISDGRIRIANDIPADLEILADPLVSRVMYNLLDNAIRYGGKITTVRFAAEESCSDVRLICEDDGEGIPLEFKERIFERGFGRNTGMGLFLAREILSITGISLRETGEPGTGARFEMVVPEGMYRVGSGVLRPASVREGQFLVPVPGTEARADIMVREHTRLAECRDTGPGGSGSHLLIPASGK